MIRVKICGITTLDDALVAAAAGADAVGFNFCPESPRYLEPARAAEIVALLSPFVTPVGVFVNEAPLRIERIARAARVRAVQLHGDEEPAEVEALTSKGHKVVKAFRMGRRFRAAELKNYSSAAAFLLDSEVKGKRGGTGKSFDWRKARPANRHGRILLAGGLTVENVAEAIQQAQPYGVDVCSGVESQPGVKDHALLRAFIRAAKSVAVA
ncbi:MAG TPA: phosphoribosylanthranilate isomerase [Candidatus Xenobia bacterium]|nr:phosphoribosylanthranilate isomerase [Candidatus Xenobia bacterium]